ncbi:(2Fe-2S)-binding protein [Thalassospira marina]|uniref:(2Fe-2S)-binding protein n=1 Tax=Thalassospira marina TaxID=2048283 RepID=UPI0015623166
MIYELNINKQTYQIEADADTPLLWVLRDILGLTDTKFGCGAGLCGACTVHIDGMAQRACLTPISEVTDAEILTLAGILETETGKKLQQAWNDLDVVQCGYCQPGQIMSAAALLEETGKPSDQDISNSMAGNICRCGTYDRIRQAIHHAASIELPHTMEPAK